MAHVGKPPINSVESNLVGGYSSAEGINSISACAPVTDNGDEYRRAYLPRRIAFANVHRRAATSLVGVEGSTVGFRAFERPPDTMERDPINRPRDLSAPYLARKSRGRGNIRAGASSGRSSLGLAPHPTMPYECA